MRHNVEGECFRNCVVLFHAPVLLFFFVRPETTALRCSPRTTDVTGVRPEGAKECVHWINSVNDWWEEDIARAGNSISRLIGPFSLSRTRKIVFRGSGSGCQRRSSSHGCADVLINLLRSQCSLAGTAVISAYLPLHAVLATPCLDSRYPSPTVNAAFVPQSREALQWDSSADSPFRATTVIFLMCGQYRLPRRKKIVEEQFDTTDWQDDWSPRYNIARPSPSR
jgi:hypothetical protein